MVVVGTGKIGSRILNRDYPLTEGLIAGTTTQEGDKEELIAEASYVESKDLKGIR